MLRYTDLFGRINLHGSWSVDHLEESHKFIAGPFRASEGFDFWLFLETLDMPALCGSDNDGNPRWTIEVRAASPECVGDSELASALRSCGWDGMDPDNPSMIAEMLDSYGTHANLASYSGGDLHKLIREALRESREVIQNIGSYLSRKVNKLGTTGMEMMSGELLAPLYRAPQEGEDRELQLARRMYASAPSLLGGPNPLYEGGTPS